MLGKLEGVVSVGVLGSKRVALTNINVEGAVLQTSVELDANGTPIRGTEFIRFASFGTDVFDRMLAQAE
jgi:hypothetical protein